MNNEELHALLGEIQFLMLDANMEIAKAEATLPEGTNSSAADYLHHARCALAAAQIALDDVFVHDDCDACSAESAPKSQGSN